MAEADAGGAKPVRWKLVVSAVVGFFVLSFLLAGLLILLTPAGLLLLAACAGFLWLCGYIVWCLWSMDKALRTFARRCDEDDG